MWLLASCRHASVHRRATQCGIAYRRSQVRESRSIWIDGAKWSPKLVFYLLCISKGGEQLRHAAALTRERVLRPASSNALPKRLLCRNSGPIMPLSGWVAIRGCVSPEEQVSEVCSISRSDE